ncbi:interferon-induced transmembrane protein [Stackebrandtia albiflava]|uniref:Interferon-induced transmembrane protein n=1 Tax=Stackebrandtia albiflava TaxID=406432 RepID=A0A562V1E0_9ACTN|nr:CD225/dispanin family protein [Stackebrandtia albiflava]TWJ11617.1 interferon-induced transmembrane protein [Stackebrandtia albiflava]
MSTPMDRLQRPIGPPAPPTYLAPAIIATLFCCLIPGIVAIVYAAKVEGTHAAGHHEDARRYSALAKGWLITSVALGLVAIIVVLLSRVPDSAW